MFLNRTAFITLISLLLFGCGDKPENIDGLLIPSDGHQGIIVVNEKAEVGVHYSETWIKKEQYPGHINWNFNATTQEGRANIILSRTAPITSIIALTINYDFSDKKNHLMKIGDQSIPLDIAGNYYFFSNVEKGSGIEIYTLTDQQISNEASDYKKRRGVKATVLMSKKGSNDITNEMSKYQ